MTMFGEIQSLKAELKNQKSRCRSIVSLLPCANALANVVCITYIILCVLFRV